MAASDGFFIGDVREGTRVKLALLKNFLTPWTAKLSFYAQQTGRPTIWFVDLFAGEGVLGLGESGSPLIAAALSKNQIENHKPVKLGIIAIEQQKRRFNSLEAFANKYRASGVPFITLHGDWRSYVEKIIEITNGCPILLFVDPFGLKGVNFPHLRLLLRRHSPVDMVMRLHDAAVYRNADLYPCFISSQLGTSSWNDGWDVITDTKTRMSIVRRAVKDVVTHEMGSKADAIAYPVRLRYESSANFTILFASRHSDAMDIWNEELGRYELALIDNSYSNLHGQQSFSPFILHHEREVSIDSMVQQRLDSIPSATGKELLDWLRRDKEYIVHNPEIQKSLSRLMKLGSIDREPNKKGYLNVHFWSLNVVDCNEL